MARYACQTSEDHGKTWSTTPLLYANSKREIEMWGALRKCSTPGCNNLDWRVGFLFKFRDSATQYNWFHVTGKNAGKEVKV